MGKEALEMKENLMEGNFRIGIIGPMGAGKTKLAETLGREWDMKVIPEKYEENPFLPGFYRNLGEGSFASQVWFYTNRARQISGNKEKSGIIDNYLRSNKIFALAQSKMGWMSPDEFELYENLCSTLDQLYFIQEPNVVIYVKADRKVLDRRIAGRNRAIETHFNEDQIIIFNKYLETLFGLFEEWRENNSHKNVIEVDTTKNNYLVEKKLQEELVLDVGNSIKDIYPGFPFQI